MLLEVLTTLINQIFKASKEVLKIGVLTPVFKKKGSSGDARNNRGITSYHLLQRSLRSFSELRFSR